ncbi:CAP domain-containing protein [Massilia forsythiae]|uniref:CAP domain-containing protein n=1 Tax=Massilia forsythiae TaxID=2728020 RepID=A0A7Z2VUS2_9BURK|nr:CAP domain-containing protein [Massilia forsythiae]QJD99835.1 CAP domain-containing protein [Massilia forsythiae]
MIKRYKQRYEIKLLVAVVFTSGLTGCGGGSSSPATSTPVATTPTNPTPTPPVSTVQAAELQTAAPAAYPAGSVQANAFAEFNAFRAIEGLGPVRQNTNIDIAAKNHAAYVQTNMSGGDAHHEIAGNPGFTGAEPGDRVIAAGYASAYTTEVIAFEGIQQTSVQALLSTVFHRNAMMVQGLTDVGIAPGNDSGPTYINAGYIKQQKNAGDYVGVFPYDKQTGVPMTHHTESPNPFYKEFEMTQANVCAKTSYPISIATETSTILKVTTFTVTPEGQSTPLDVRLMVRDSTDQNLQYLGANVAYIVGKAPFTPGTKYTVHFVGTATGTATGSAKGLTIDKTWTFTTDTKDAMGCS